MHDKRSSGRSRCIIVSGLPLIPLLLPLVVDPVTGATTEAAKAVVRWLGVGALAVAALVARAAWRSPACAGVLLSSAPLLAAAMSTALVLDPMRSLVGSSYWRGGFLTLAAGVALCVLATRTLHAGELVDRLFRAVTAGSVPVAVYALMQLARLDPIPWGGLESARPSSTLGSPVILGNYLAMALPIAVAQLVTRRGGRERYVGAMVIALQVAALLSTATRGAWIAAGAALAVLVVGRIGARRGWPILLGVAAVVLVATVFLRPERGQATAFRLDLWRDALSLLADRPILGHGPEGFALAFPAYESDRLRQHRAGVIDHAHNLWLDLAADVGLVGVALWTALVALVLRRGVRAIERARAVAASQGGDAAMRRGDVRENWLVSAALLASLIAYLVAHTSTFPTIVPTSLFWLLAGATLRLTSEGEDRRAATSAFGRLVGIRQTSSTPMAADLGASTASSVYPQDCEQFGDHEPQAGRNVAELHAVGVPEHQWRDARAEDLDRLRARDEEQ